MKHMKYLLALCPLWLLMAGGVLLASCDDMLDMGNDDVLYTNENTLNSANDTVNTYMGVLYQLQKIAVRTNLFGELRGDLTTVYQTADDDLKAISNFEVSNNNAYNNPRDYYAVINNCNYYLANANTNLSEKRHQYGMSYDYYVMRAEFVAVRTIRAWLYLQLGQIYGDNIPLITEPILTVDDDERAWEQAPRKNLAAICDYFIDDLEAYKDWFDYPANGRPSRASVLPLPVVLGDLYLWRSAIAHSTSDAERAAKCYYDYIAWTPNAAAYAGAFNNNSYKKVNVTGSNYLHWNMSNGKYVDDASVNDSYSNGNVRTNASGINKGAINRWFDTSRFGDTGNDVISVITMDKSEGGIYTNELKNLYCFNQQDESIPASLGPSQPCITYSESQVFGDYYKAGTTPAIFLKREEAGIPEALKQQHIVGDLRLGLTVRSMVSGDNNLIWNWKMVNTSDIIIYRTSDIYLRMAEALNYAGYPKFAKQILTTGLDYTVMNYLVYPQCKTDAERAFVNYFRFPLAYFHTQLDPDATTIDNPVNADFSGHMDGFWADRQTYNQIGIHQRGSGHPQKLEENGYYYPAGIDVIPTDLPASSYDATPNCPQTYADLMMVPADIRTSTAITNTKSEDYYNTLVADYATLIDRAKANTDAWEYLFGLNKKFTGIDFTDYETEEDKKSYIVAVHDSLVVFHIYEVMNWNQRNLDLIRPRQTEVIDSLLDVESALETCFEGFRFGFLMRADYRCGGTGRKMGGGKTYAPGQYLADKVGERDAALKGKLANRNNWFFKWKDEKTGHFIGKQ